MAKLRNISKGLQQRLDRLKEERKITLRRLKIIDDKEQQLRGLLADEEMRWHGKSKHDEHGTNNQWG